MPKNIKKTKQLYPFTDYSPKTEARLKRLFRLGERGTLRRVIQDGMIVGILGIGQDVKYTLKLLRFRRVKPPEVREAVTLSDEEIRRLHPRAEIIKRGRGGVTIIPEGEKQIRLGRSKAPRITPKTPRLRR